LVRDNVARAGHPQVNNDPFYDEDEEDGFNMMEGRNRMETIVISRI